MALAAPALENSDVSALAEAVKEHRLAERRSLTATARRLWQGPSEIASCLLMAFGLILPLSTAAGTVAALGLVVCFLVQGNFKKHLKRFRSNRLVLALAAFLLLHLIGLLWTQDVRWGLHTVNKQWRLLLIPIIMVLAQKEHIQYYFDAYIYGMALLCLLSCLNLLHLVDYMPMTRISYNPMLALSIYLILHLLLFRRVAGWKQMLFAVLLVMMSVNMFLTEGRAGHLVFFVLILLTCFQYLQRRPLLALGASIVLPLLIFSLSFYYSAAFHKRVVGAVNEVVNFQMNQKSMDGNDRLTYFVNTFELIREAPLLGVGTGDFPAEYARINQVRSPAVEATVNPHNNYLLVQAQFGLLGLVSLLAIFLVQVRCARHGSDGLDPWRLALPIFFLTIMLFDSYLMSHYGGMTFAYFSGILYGDCEAV